MEALEDRRVLASVTVSTVADAVNGNVSSLSALIASPGPDGISLREAIAASATSGAGDTINFASSLNGQSITLARAFLGEISFAKSITIDAGGLPDGITIDADDPTPNRTGTGIRVFNISAPGGGSAPPLVTLVGLTLKGGDVGDSTPAEGGAIRSEARLILRDCTIKENEADIGGGVFVQVAGGATPREVLRIEDSLTENNDADEGGGVAIISGSLGASTNDTISIIGTTIRNNEVVAQFQRRSFEFRVVSSGLRIEGQMRKDGPEFLLN